MYELKADRITLLSASMRGGGAERVILNLANYFSSKGFMVDLLLVSAEGSFLPEISCEIRTINLKAKRTFYAIPELIKYFRQERPAVVLSAMTHVNIIAIISRVLAGSKSRLLISEHSNLSETIKSAQLKRIKFLHYWVKLFYRSADRIIAVSEGVKNDLIRIANISDELIEVIYNPIVNRELLIKAEENVVHPWVSEKSEPVILSVGRLQKEKDFITLIKAFSLLLEVKAAKLIILGKGSEYSNLLKLIKSLKLESHIDLPGFVGNPYAYMSKASLFVLSSRYEGLSNTIIEAMACGCPVVSTDCPSGPSEILENGKYGPLVPVGNIEKLAEAMLYVLNNPPNSEVLRKRSLDFSVEVNGEKYLKLLVNK